MNRFESLINRFFPILRPIPAGVYHRQETPEGETPYRLHLRIEPDGSGVLIVNASTVLHLNQTAAEFAYHMIQGDSDEDSVGEVARRYQVSHEQAQADFASLKERLLSLAGSEDLDPVTYLDFERMDPYSASISAPYRLDCALTYRTSEGESGQAPADRVRRELLTDEWKQILDKAWNAGIPHVIFTGGEPTTRVDLCDIIAHAERLGMVTGLLTDGSRLSETRYLRQLLDSGLDHIMLLLNPVEEMAWEALRDVLAENIHVTVHLTVTPANEIEMPRALDRLAGMGVPALSLSTINAAQSELLANIRQAAAHRGLTLVWDLPVPYSRFNPVTQELSQTAAPSQGAGKGWLYVEPDGDVLPAQGHNQVLGNLLSDTWESIWQARRA
jgi:hypothetical protein